MSISEKENNILIMLDESSLPEILMIYRHARKYFLKKYECAVSEAMTELSVLNELFMEFRKENEAVSSKTPFPRVDDLGELYAKGKENG